MKTNFTDKFIKGRKCRAAPKGKRVEHWDTAVPNFGIRITHSGTKTWIVYRRWPGSTAAARLEVGDAKLMTLTEARDKAREMLRMAQDGKNPRAEQRREEARREQERETTFGAVAEAWMIAIGRQRKAHEVRADVRREFVGPWKDRPVIEITRQDVARIVISKRDAGHLAQARNLLGYVKRLFDWTVAQQVYDLEVSPAERLTSKKLIGPRNMRRRVLRDDELRMVWGAAGEIGFPYGPLVHLLILTGLRRSVVAEARWSEIDLNNKLWTISADRMKMDDDFLVPLAGDTLAVLRKLPRFADGDYLFSSSLGATPINGHSRAKERFDEITGAFEKPWVFHDLRRTMRTHLSALPIPDNVRELMIAHAQGLKKVYDQYLYLEEKRAGFGLWEARLRGILQRQASNVVALRG
jgi:integrase